MKQFDIKKWIAQRIIRTYFVIINCIETTKIYDNIDEKPVKNK